MSLNIPHIFKGLRRVYGVDERK